MKCPRILVIIALIYLTGAIIANTISLQLKHDWFLFLWLCVIAPIIVYLDSRNRQKHPVRTAVLFLCSALFLGKFLLPANISGIFNWVSSYRKIFVFLKAVLEVSLIVYAIVQYRRVLIEGIKPETAISSILNKFMVDDPVIARILEIEFSIWFFLFTPKHSLIKIYEPHYSRLNIQNRAKVRYIILILMCIWFICILAAIIIPFWGALTLVISLYLTMLYVADRRSRNFRYLTYEGEVLTIYDGIIKKISITKSSSIHLLDSKKTLSLTVKTQFKEVFPWFDKPTAYINNSSKGSSAFVCKEIEQAIRIFLND